MKAVVLLSGGIDSATCLGLTVKRYGAKEVIALTAFYKQKHAKELVAAKNVAEYYGVQKIEIDLADAFNMSDCPLIQGNRKIKHTSYAEQLEELGGEGTVDTYVPFRNGLFIAYATTVAVSVGAEVILYGAHKDDAAGRAYPDCTSEFAEAMKDAVYEGSGRTCYLQAPFLDSNKAEIVKVGLEIGVPYRLTWSCYEGEKKPCGTCATCIDRAKAFAENGVTDPALEAIKCSQ